MNFKPLAHKIRPLHELGTRRSTLPPLSPGKGPSPWAAQIQVLSRNTHTEADRSSSGSSSPDNQPHSRQPESGPRTISDHEWTLRAGRVVHTLRTTLPNFFETGLVSSVEPPMSGSRSSKALNSRQGPESIYASNIRLSYSPPTAWSLPSPFPKTLQVEGLPLYHASATFIRHTLGAFNHDLHVDMSKLQVRSSGTRTREIAVRTVVSGKSRISGVQNEWDVHSTYSLSPQTALIDLHTVESIRPAPHVTFYDGLRAALARLAGTDIGREGAAAGPAGQVRGCVSDPKFRPVPLREQITNPEKE